MTAVQNDYTSLLKVAQIYKSLNRDYHHNAELIQNILEKEGDINQVIPASVLVDYTQCALKEYTILHIAAIEKDFRIFKLLLDNGADFTMQNDQGDTVLHCLFDCQSDNKEHEFIEAVLSAHVRFVNSSNPCNRNGISHFHIACMTNHTEAVQFFLDNSSVSIHQFVNMDSPILSGFSPLHFAVKGCSIEIVKILLKNHANINAKDGRGRTPMDILLQRKLKLCDYLKESKEEILQKVHLMDDLTNLLLRNKDLDDSNLTKFHVACTMQDSSMVEYYLADETMDINHHVNFNSPIFPGYTALHFAAHCNMRIFIMLLKKGALTGVKNAKGITPLDIHLRRCKFEDVLTILKSKEAWGTSMFSDGKTQLIKFVTAMCESLQSFSHVKIAIDDINIFVEEPLFWDGFTPLHFAVLISDDSNMEPVIWCLNHKADLTVQDIRGWTPTHLAFRMNKIEITILLLESYRSTVELIDKEGLSLHHIVQKLIGIPSAFNRVLHSLTKWFDERDVFAELGLNSLHVASYSGDCKFFNRMSCQPNSNINALISCEDPDIFWSKYYGYTPLHLAIEQLVSVEFFDILLKNGADLFASGPNGMTPVYAILTDLTSYKYLMDPLVSKLEKCYEYRRYLKDLSGITMLHVHCRNYNFHQAARDILERGIDVNAKVHEDCPIWPGYTPLHVLLKYANNIEEQYFYEQFQTLLGMLLAQKADVMEYNIEGDTPIHLSLNLWVHDYNFACTSILMDHHKNFHFNALNSKRMSHFHAACIVNNVEAVKQFLDHGVDVNEPIDFFDEKFGGETPLHLILKRTIRSDNLMEVVDLLLACGANVLTEDSYGCTVLHRAACNYSWSTKLFEKLIKSGADVDAKNIFGETPMELLLKVNEISLSVMEVLLKSGCQLNSCNHITEEGYLSMIIDEKYHKLPQTKVFERMMAVLEVPQVDKMGRTALHNIVTTSNADVHTFDYVEIIDKFQRLGVDLDHQDELGKTALHLASQFGNSEAVTALINAGAEINVADFNNKTALFWALELPSTKKHNRDNIVNTLVNHVRKLQFFGLHVSQLNERLLNDNHLSATFDSQSLLCEMKNVRKVVVDTQPQLMLEDFILETESLKSYPFAGSKRDKVEKRLKSAGDKLPEMKGVLMLQYRRTLKRVVG